MWTTRGVAVEARRRNVGVGLLRESVGGAAFGSPPRLLLRVPGFRSALTLLEDLLDSVGHEPCERGAKIRLLRARCGRMSSAAERLRDLRQIDVAVG